MQSSIPMRRVSRRTATPSDDVRPGRTASPPFVLVLLMLLLPTPSSATAHGAAPSPTAAVTASVVAPAGDEAVPEFALKAAFLFNFARYTEWPEAAFADDDAPIVLGILGVDPFGDILDELLAGKEINDRQVVLKRYASLDKLERCHLLFVSRSMEKQWKDVHKRIQDWNVFTVADFGDFARDGGVARFFIQSLQVRFEINVDAAERAKLKISSQLLKLSVVVKDD